MPRHKDHATLLNRTQAKKLRIYEKAMKEAKSLLKMWQEGKQLRVEEIDKVIETFNKLSI